MKALRGGTEGLRDRLAALQCQGTASLAILMCRSRYEKFS